MEAKERKTDTDLAIFMGQSNMAGRGEAKQAAVCGPQMGSEFRAVSDPGRLYPIVEPFGRYENRAGGLDDGDKKSGSLVSAFVREYYEKTGRHLVAVSASQGGTCMSQWLDTLAFDAEERLKTALGYLRERGREPEHVFMVWCQGETDGDLGTSVPEYEKGFLQILERMHRAGAQQCFLISIGHFNTPAQPWGRDGVSAGELEERYERIRRTQEEICAGRQDVILASSFEPWQSRMKDAFHYRQKAYDAVGRQAAAAAAGFLKTVQKADKGKRT